MPKRYRRGIPLDLDQETVIEFQTMVESVPRQGEINVGVPAGIPLPDVAQQTLVHRSCKSPPLR